MQTREQLSSLRFSRCGGVQLDITAATSSKPKVLQTASSISWLTLFLHSPQPTYTCAIFFLLFIFTPLPPSFFLHPLKNFSTRHPRNFQITSPFSSSFLKIYFYPPSPPVPSFRSHLSLRSLRPSLVSFQKLHVRQYMGDDSTEKQANA